MKLRFCAGLHYSGIKAIVHCQTNQPEVWAELCRGLDIRSGLISGSMSLLFYQLSNKKAIKFYCADCENLWSSELKTKALSVLETLFGCHIDSTISAYVGLYPTYLRSIRERYFLLPYGVSLNRIREIIIHELSHFYCYVASGDSLTSNMLWQLSECLVPFILKYNFGINSHEFSYMETGLVSEKKLFYSWANKKMSFEKLLVLLKQHEQCYL